MTLFAETSPRVSYLGTGVTVDFTYPFRVLEDVELAVYVDGDLKGLGSHYSVTGIDTPTGGTVTFFTPPALNALILLMRDMPLTQPVDLREHDALSAETQEREYDRLTMLIQWQEDQHAHMLRLADLSPTILPQGSLPEPEVGKFLRWHDPTHLDNAEVVSAGSLSIGGNVAGHATFWVSPTGLGGDPAFWWDPARRGLKLARGFHEGSTPLTPHKDGLLHVFLKNADNVNGYQGILVTLHNGAPTDTTPLDTLSTLGNDKVAVGGWTKRGFGGTSPIYGGNFGVVFDTTGVANGVEIDCQNDSGVDGHGQGLWVNGSGGNHRSNAILIDTQDATKWENGIKFTSNFGGGATGNVTNAGIVFDHNQSQTHILIVPFDDLNPSNNVFELRDSVFDQVRAGIQKRGAFAGRASATGFNDPTFTWTDSPRSGVYSPAIEEFAITTNGFPRVRITDSGDTYLYPLAGSGTAGVSVEASGRLIRGAGGGGGGGAITSPLVVSGAAAGELRLLELPANGTDFVGLKAPAAVAASKVWTWPGIDGTNGQVLTTDGALGLAWTTPAGGGGGAVTSVGGLAGVIGITNDVNVTMTSTAPNLVLGWTGTLATARGGTGTGGSPPGQVAIWTAGGVTGDAALQWDNAVGAKKLTVGQPNVLASPSKVVTLAGRSTGGSDPVLEVRAAFAGASPTVNYPVGATFLGDFLGGTQMPVGFGVTVELALHDYFGAGTFLPAAFISTSLAVLSPLSTALVLGAQVSGLATSLLTLNGAFATFAPGMGVLIGSGHSGGNMLLNVANQTGTGHTRLEAGGGAVGATRTALTLVRSNAGAMTDGFGVRQDFVLRDSDLADNVVGRLVFESSGGDNSALFRLQTALGSATPTDRLSINAAGQMFYVTPAAGNGLFALAATGTARATLAFYTNNGAQAVGLIAPPTATGNPLWTLPTTLGTAGQLLSLLDGVGTLGWAAFPSTLTLTDLQVGPAPVGGQAAGPLKVTVSNSDNVLPYQAILAQLVNGSSAGIGPATIVNDKVAVSGASFRGAGGTSPIYGGHFTVTFATAGVANGIEVGVQNNTGAGGAGQGVWINGAGTNHRSNALLIDTQNATKWDAAIRITEGNVGGGATGSLLNYGLIFDKSHDQDFLVIRPRVGVAANVALRITDAAFTANKFAVTNDGQIMAGTVTVPLPGAGSISTSGGITTNGNVGALQYFAASLPGQTVNVTTTGGTLHFTGGILTSVT